MHWYTCHLHTCQGLGNPVLGVQLGAGAYHLLSKRQELSFGQAPRPGTQLTRGRERTGAQVRTTNPFYFAQTHIINVNLPWA